MAKRKPSKNRKTIKRTTRHFQLRVEHPIDQHVAEILDFKRSQRAEVTAIRDGVRLLWALENGDLSVLFDMFPQYKAQLAPPTAAGGGGELDEIKGLLEMIASQQSSGSGYVMQSVTPPIPPKAAAPPVATVGQGKQVSADEIANNFLSMF